MSMMNNKQHQQTIFGLSIDWNPAKVLRCL